MNKHLASIMGLTLLGVFLLSSVWEFWLEDLFYLSMSPLHEPESLKTKWEFVFSAVSFSGLAMIIPAILTLRSQSQQNEMVNALKESEELARTLFTQLRSIVSGTAPATSGEDFFQSLVYHLAEALKVNYVFIDETTDRKNTFRTLAFCVHGKIVDNIEYNVIGTPCEVVYQGQAAIYPEKVREKFPEDVHVQEWEIESYLGFPLMDDSGKVIGLLGIMDNKPIADVDNVTSILSIFASRAAAELQRRDAKERLSKKALELERVNKELQDFASIASHDLQEPLRKIIILGDRLESTIQNSNEKGRDYLVRMQNSASKMQSFIQDLLQYTKVGTKDRNLELVDLKEIAKNIVNELEHRLAETKGTVNMNGLPVIEADAFQMNQLFLNLIGNGLKFHRDGVPPAIDISCAKGNNGFWEIFVEDNGIGIDEKHIDKIFKPFMRLHGQDTYQGTGIGLTICNKIVTGHGGTIAVKKSSQGNGSIFHISLPEKPHTETI
jgi:signal transduction histidine kinase